MEIILSILQILGIILLVIMGLILLILLIILFVPIRYQISGQMQNRTNIEVKAFWLFHLFSVKATYEDELFDVEIKALWNRNSLTKGMVAPSNNNQEQVSQETNTKEQWEENFTTEDSDKIKETKTDFGKFKKIKNRINIIKEKIIFIKEKWAQIKKLLQDTKNQQAIKHLKDELIYLINILLPRKSLLNGIFSAGSPDTTGQIFGVICCFPIIYQDNWNLTPDFEAEIAYFQGEFHGKGRLYIYRLVGILIRIITDKNCRRLYYFINRLGGEKNGRGK